MICNVTTIAIVKGSFEPCYNFDKQTPFPEFGRGYSAASLGNYSEKMKELWPRIKKNENLTYDNEYSAPKYSIINFSDNTTGENVWYDGCFGLIQKEYPRCLENARFAELVSYGYNNPKVFNLIDFGKPINGVEIIRSVNDSGNLLQAQNLSRSEITEIAEKLNECSPA